MSYEELRRKILQGPLNKNSMPPPTVGQGVGKCPECGATFPIRIQLKNIGIDVVFPVGKGSGKTATKKLNLGIDTPRLEPTRA